MLVHVDVDVLYLFAEYTVVRLIIGTMTTPTTTTTLCGNEVIAGLLQKGEPFSIVRCGIGAETVFAYHYSNQLPVPPQIQHGLHNNAGIYFHDKYNNLDKLAYANRFGNAIKTSDYIGVWYGSWVHSIEQHYIQKYGLEQRHFAATDIEPYYFERPWSAYLENKRVLVIHPFASSIESQYAKRTLLFDNPAVLPNFTLLTLKTPLTLAMNRTGDSWMDNYNELCKQIDGLEFDVALLGCGGMGLPLVNYIKSKGHSAIYVGGALQILFGIKGKRWDENPNISRFYNEHWIRPRAEEHAMNEYHVEGGCYW